MYIVKEQSIIWGGIIKTGVQKEVLPSYTHIHIYILVWVHFGLEVNML